MNEGCTTTTLDTPSTLHPSEIRFTCPPWCKLTREEHLAELGNLEGAALHASADRTGPAWVVSLSSFTYPDGTPARGQKETLVNVCVEDCDMTSAQLSEFREALMAAGTEALR